MSRPRCRSGGRRLGWDSTEPTISGRRHGAGDPELRAVRGRWWTVPLADDRPNGKAVASSAEGYKRKSGVENALERVRQCAPTAPSKSSSRGTAVGLSVRGIEAGAARVLEEALFDLRRAERYQRWVLDALGLLAPLPAVLEVGAGSGNYTRWLAARHRRVVAVEPEEALARRIVELGLPNVEVVAAGVDEVPGGRRFDAAVLINVLEHVEDDAALLGAAAARVRPGGLVAVVVPAHPTLYGTLDETYAHLRRYRRREVAALLDRVGLTGIEARYLNALGAVGWWMTGRLLRRRHLDPAAVTVTERLVVPIARRLESRWSPPFGQSVIATGRVPG